MASRVEAARAALIRIHRCLTTHLSGNYSPKPRKKKDFKKEAQKRSRFGPSSLPRSCISLLLSKHIQDTRAQT